MPHGDQQHVKRTIHPPHSEKEVAARSPASYEKINGCGRLTLAMISRCLVYIGELTMLGWVLLLPGRCLPATPRLKEIM
jgi:hypothetical protein